MAVVVATVGACPVRVPVVFIMDMMPVMVVLVVMVMVMVMVMVVAVAVVVIVTMEQMWSPDENDTENDDDSSSNDIREVTNIIRQGSRYHAESQSDGEAAKCGAYDKSGRQAEDEFATVFTGNKRGKYEPGMTTWIYSVNKSEKQAALQGNEEYGVHDLFEPRIV